MTKRQWAIIGVFGAAVILIFTCVGCLFLARLAGPSRPVASESKPTSISEASTVATKNTITPSTTLEQVSQPTRTSKPTDTLQPTDTARPSDTPSPTEIPQPTATPTIFYVVVTSVPMPSVSYEQLEDWWDDFDADRITRLQLEERFATVKGKRVHWVAEVSNAYSDGDVTLNVNSRQCLSCIVYLEGVPLDKARALRPKQIIEFDGQITLVDAGLIAFSCHVKWFAFSALSEISTRTPTPPKTTSSLTYQEIKENYDRMPSAQRQGYLNNLIGTRIHWKGSISDITKGQVRGGGSTIFVMIVEMEGEGLFDIVTLLPISEKDAQRFSKGQGIEFDATISQADDVLGLYIGLQLISLALVQ